MSMTIGCWGCLCLSFRITSIFGGKKRLHRFGQRLRKALSAPAQKNTLRDQKPKGQLWLWAVLWCDVLSAYTALKWQMKTCDDTTFTSETINRPPFSVYIVLIIVRRCLWQWLHNCSWSLSILFLLPFLSSPLSPISLLNRSWPITESGSAGGFLLPSPSVWSSGELLGFFVLL